MLNTVHSRIKLNRAAVNSYEISGQLVINDTRSFIRLASFKNSVNEIYYFI